MKIDLVCLWVDGNDPAWRAKKNSYLPKGEQLEEEIAGDCRFVEREELKYSLRSIEKFAPWINHIYIVTDSQTPKWLDTSHPKITIVDHTEIVPAEYLPTFNSNVLEFHIHKIKGLTEHFLYGNDDTMFGREVDEKFFFYPDGEPVVRIAPHKTATRRGAYARMLTRMQSLIRERYGKCCEYAPHHNIDSYRKSDFEATIAEFAEEFEPQKFGGRFRSDNDMQRTIVQYRLAELSYRMPLTSGRYNGASSIWEVIKQFVTRRHTSDSRCFSVRTANLKKRMNFYNPALFTVNDDQLAVPDDHRRTSIFLEYFLPEKSQFEL